ncbi:hypothetical protein SUGI_0687810 [Cryptomeria japonica]|nr:hypothetical protein SUGI_0687810 [Cryptomeria japonica]
MTENGDVLNDNSEPMEVTENGDSLKSKSNSEESESPCAALDPKSLETEQPMEQLVCRSQRTRTVPSQYDDFVTFDCELNFAAIDEPSSFQEATASDAWRNPTIDGSYGKNNGVEIGSIIGGILGVQLILVLMLIYHRRYSRKPDLPVKVPNHVRTRSFSREQLRTATQNFSQEIGKGCFGTVFHGKLLDGKEIAVKIGLLSRVNHKNLVSLLGYCNSSTELMLVYEYVGGRSLRDHLHGSLAKASTLDWKARIRVALDAAEGLEYLHWRATQKIIHRDVKSSNILLDLNMRAKVADFGLSKILQDDGISNVTTTIKGTLGYLDPEYFSTSKLTERSDVYSFGVVLLELICGRKPIEDEVCEEEVNLVRWVTLHAEANEDTPSRLTNIIDQRLSLGENEMQCFNYVVNLALQCVDREGSKRPTMNEIVAGIRVAMLYMEPKDINAEKSVDALSQEEYSTADYSSSLLHVGR